MPQFVRGTQASFEASFLDYDGTPMVPADRESWPAVAIRDPDDTTVATGVGNPIAEGQYRFNWFVPTTATLTTANTTWRIDWSMFTSTGHSHAASETFEVVDRIESSPEERSHSYITNDGGTIRALFRWPSQLYEVKLAVKSSTGSEIYTEIPGVATNDTQNAGCNPNRLINETVQDGEYVYFYDVGPLSAGEYQFHWTYMESEVSERNVAVQIVRAVPDLFWHYNAELRGLIDRLQKHADIVQAYSDADVYSYIKGGLDILNFYPPSTNFMLADIPLTGSRGFRGALIYCSAIHAINAQQILEVELNFDHSGQTVTLNYNHDYSGILGNLERLLEQFKEAKLQVFRLAQGAAFSGARIKNYRYSNRVFRLNQTLRGIVPPGGAALWRNLGI